MTKKHYEAIAKILRDDVTCLIYDEYADNHGVARALANYFATDNPKFDRVRFLQACGVSE